MSKQTGEILVAILGGTAILLVLALTLISLVILYRRKQKEYFLQKEKLQESFRKELLQAQLETQEQTFQSLSQELHDNIGQVLSLAKLNMSLIGLNGPRPADDTISQTKNLLNTAINDLRDISKTLNSSYVKEKTLTESIERDLGILRRTRKFEAALEVTGKPFFLSAERRLILYRMVQESINNIVRHAGATHITIRLAYTDDALTIWIEDDGCGFDTDVTPKGVGLLNMEHRSAMINSDVKVTSTPGKGSCVRIRIAEQEKEQP